MRTARMRDETWCRERDTIYQVENDIDLTAGFEWLRSWEHGKCGKCMD